MKIMKKLPIITLMVAMSLGETIFGMLAPFQPLYIVSDAPQLKDLSASVSATDFSKGSSWSLYQNQPFSSHSGGLSITAPGNQNVYQNVNYYEKIDDAIGNLNNNANNNARIYENVNRLSEMPHDYLQFEISTSILPCHIEIYSSGKKIIDYTIDQNEYDNLFTKHQGVLKITPLPVRGIGLVEGNENDIAAVAESHSLARPLYIINSSGVDLSLSVKTLSKRIMLLDRKPFDIYRKIQINEPASPSNHTYHNINNVAVQQKKLDIHETSLPYEISFYDKNKELIPVYNQEGKVVNPYVLDTNKLIGLITDAQNNSKRKNAILKIVPASALKNVTHGYSLEKSSNDEAESIKSLHGNNNNRRHTGTLKN